jgi:DNA helicase-2/ATP-dependent DNA helicase PcrA
MNLNQKQREAAEAPPTGVSVINAIAGSGKTTVLLERAQHLYKEAPGKIGCVVFNASVSEEITAKVEKLPNKFAAANTFVSTSYSLAWRMVRQHFLKLGMKKAPSVAPEWKAVKQGLEATRMMGYKFKEFEMKALLAAEAWRVSALAEDYSQIPSATIAMRSIIEQYTNPTLVSISKALRQKRREASEILFQDMITFALELEDSQYADVGFRHLLIDEAQDLSPAQHRFIKRLLKFADSATFVGDSSQSIYAFSSAEPRIFKAIPKDYGAKEYTLDINYRSKQPILDLANEILKLPEMDTSVRMNANGDQPGDPVVTYKNQDDVVFWINSLQSSGVDYNDIAVVHRARSHILLLEMALAGAGIPYKCSSGSFFDHSVADDLMAYYKLMFKPSLESWKTVAKHYKYFTNEAIEEAYKQSPSEPWRHVPTRLFKTEGQKMTWWGMRDFLDSIHNRIRKESPITVCSELIGKLLRKKWTDDCSSDPDMEMEYRMMQQSMLTWLDKFKSGEELWQFFTQRPKVSDEGVTISTVHKAKGLEWDHVALWNVGSRTFPLREDEPEEYRLLYVAVTRAKDTLTIFPSKKDETAGVLGQLTSKEANELERLFGL